MEPSINTHNKYSRKTALVTGASRGIGRAIAAELSNRGYNLYLTGFQHSSELKEFADSLNTDTRIFIGDISDSAFVKNIFEQITDLDLLVNNAGISMTGLLQDMSDDDWLRINSVNTNAAFYTCRAAIPIFLKKTDNAVPGRIINISSVWGNIGASCEVAYSATKGALNSFTRALARELAPSGIPVNAIACGFIDTDMNSHLSDDERNAVIEEIPAGRMGTTEEIAAIVASFAEMPSYMTGQIITVDGGWT